MTIDKENTNDDNDSNDDYDPYENVSKDEYDNDTNSWDVNEPQDNGDVGLGTGDHDQSNDGETTDGNNDPEQDEHDDWMYNFDHNEGITQEAPQDNSGDNVSNEQMGLNEVIIKGLLNDGDKPGKTPGVEEAAELDGEDNLSEIPGVDAVEQIV